MPHSTRPASGHAYRPDIDGLRAVAVLLVVFNHLKTRLHGGYIGVDVFFVISGYLIGAAILSEMDAGEFSIVNFYERRVRRIFPALFVMLVVTSVLAYYYFLPSEILAYAGSLLGALFSVSNFLFWHQAGYFDVVSESKPLLHTWSLAVEEQFYIFFPLFLIAVRRWLPRRLKAALWMATGVSFAFALFYMHRNADDAAFFSSPLRAWELLIGAIASQSYLPKVKGPVQRNLAAAMGLLLILIPSVRYTAQTRFPGMAAVPPCLGAILLITAGESGSSLVGRVLSWKPIVFIGLVSYSLYLWHWPIQVFLHAGLELHHASWSISEKAGRVIVFVASFVVATLSWRFVETPFRKGHFRPERRRLFLVSGFAAAIVAVIGVTMTATHGTAGRFSADVLKADAYSTYDADADWRHGQCFIETYNAFADFDKPVCLRDDPARKQLLLYGDSHAADKYVGLLKVFPELNISQATVSGCPPLVHEPEDRSENCKKMSDYIFGDYLLHRHIDSVILAGRWTEQEVEELGRTVAWLQQHGVQATVIGPGFEFGLPLPKMIAISILDAKPKSFIEGYRLVIPEELDRKMSILAREQWKARYISVYEDLCRSQVEMEAKAQPESAAGCPIYTDHNVPLLLDNDHFSAGGSIMFAESMRSKGQLP